MVFVIAVIVSVNEIKLIMWAPVNGKTANSGVALVQFHPKKRLSVGNSSKAVLYFTVKTLAAAVVNAASLPAIFLKMLSSSR
jgi:hypothetical protein